MGQGQALTLAQPPHSLPSSLCWGLPIVLIPNLFCFCSARERIVGWYHTGPKLHKNDIAINELMKRYCPNSVSGATFGLWGCSSLTFPKRGVWEALSSTFFAGDTAWWL